MMDGMLIVFALAVIWFVVRSRKPKDDPILSSLGDEDYCKGSHTWTTFESLFPINTYRDIKDNLAHLGYNTLVTGLLSKGLFCSTCRCVPGMDGMAVNSLKLASTVMDMLEQLAKEKEMLTKFNELNAETTDEPNP